MGRQKDRKGQRTVNTHAQLRAAAWHFLKQGESQEDGSFYSFMATVLFTAFFLEAYLNSLGERQMANWNATTEWLEPKKKLKAVATELGVKLDSRTRAYRAFTDAFFMRKHLVHGRRQVVEGSWSAAAHGASAAALETEWEKFCTERHARRILEGAEELARTLHVATGSDRHPFGPLSAGVSHGNGGL